MARIAFTKQQEPYRACKNLTERCDELRRAKHITQAKIAEYSGKSQPRVSYELKNGLSFETFVAIVKLTGAEISL